MAKKKTGALRDDLPFDVRIPNAATQQALQDAGQGKNLVRYASFTDFAKAMTGERHLRGRRG